MFKKDDPDLYESRSGSVRIQIRIQSSETHFKTEAGYNVTEAHGNRATNVEIDREKEGKTQRKCW